MNIWLLRAAGAGLLIVFGLLLGALTTTRYFRPLLDAEQDQVASCKAAHANLTGLVSEQGKALGDLVLAANTRRAVAEKAVSEAKPGADRQYAAATRLQQERTGGDECAAATSVIDNELGL